MNAREVRPASRFDGWLRRFMGSGTATLVVLGGWIGSRTGDLPDNFATQFMDHHGSNMMAAPWGGLIAASAGTLIARRYDKLRNYTGAALTAAALGLGGMAASQTIYETESGYEHVGRWVDENVLGFDPQPNREDPLDTTAASLATVLAAVAMARTPYRRPEELGR